MPNPPDSSDYIRMLTPATRDLQELLRSIEIVARELEFHASRFGTTVMPRNAEEAKHHANLKVGYKNAAYFVRILGQHQEERVRKFNLTREKP